MPILSQDALCARPVGLPFWIRRWMRTSDLCAPDQVARRNRSAGAHPRGVYRLTSREAGSSDAELPVQARQRGTCPLAVRHASTQHSRAVRMRQARMASAFIVMPSRFARSRRRSTFCFNASRYTRRPARVVRAGASGDNSRGSRDAVPAAPGLLPSPAGLCATRMAGRGAGGVNPNMHAFPTDVLQQDESRNHVTVARGRSDADDAALLQGARDAVERLVGELIRRQPVPAIEI